MNKQMSSRQWSVVTLVVAWGVIGMAANLLQTKVPPAMVWFWASLASIAITWAMNCFRKAAR
jgi:hypothetical protein